MANALRAGFQRIVQRARPAPVGSRLRVTRYKHFRAACSVGKCPRARTARRYRALSDSIALVEQITWSHVGGREGAGILARVLVGNQGRLESDFGGSVEREAR